MSKLFKSFTKRLAEYLEGHGTKMDLHRKTGIARVQFDRYLKGAEPGLTEVEKIAEVIGCSPGELLGLTKDTVIEREIKTEHPIEECYRRIGENLNIQKESKPMTAQQKQEQLRLRTIEALGVVKEWYDSAPLEQRDTFLEGLKKKANHDK